MLTTRQIGTPHRNKGSDMDETRIAKDQANSRKEKLKSLAVAGGETMFHAMCYTAGALLVTFLAECMRSRSNQES